MKSSCCYCKNMDEMFRGRSPCLVAIDVVSNYIILVYRKGEKANFATIGNIIDYPNS